MPIIYHDLPQVIPNNWVKNELFEPCIVNEQNDTWNEGVDQGTQYRLISKYEEHYGLLPRIGRAFLGVILIITLQFAFKSGREWIGDLFCKSIKNIHIIKEYLPNGELIDVYVSMAGNPAHMGHMQMIALGVNRLVKEGYKISKVRVTLSDEKYLEEKVRLHNVTILHHNKSEEKEMLKILIPRPMRIEFLKATIQQAKDEKVLDEQLDIEYSQNSRESDHLAAFQVCGVDFANDPLDPLNRVKHAVIVTRDGQKPERFTEAHTKDYRRFIVDNVDKTTSKYSSSRIQNGAYELLPESVRKSYEMMHQALATRYEGIKEFKCPIAEGTGIACAVGFYVTSRGIKNLRTGAQLLEQSRNIPNSILGHPVEPKYEKSEIVVNNQDCLEAAQCELKNKAKKVAVLMLASPIEPGGAMEEGNNGQEEEICRRSDIFGFMWDQAHFMATHSLYNLVDVQRAHQANPQYSLMTNNRMIHVPQVTVFRSGKSDNYKMLENPFEVGMLVSPGLDRPGYEKIDGKKRYTRVEDEEQLRKLIMTQLKVAYDENYDTVILGAFGCGAFYNPPELIAEFYKQILGTYFKGAFEKIVFAIIDDGHTLEHNPEGNLKPFQKCFESHSV